MDSERNTDFIGVCVSDNKRDLIKIVRKRLSWYPRDICILIFYLEHLDLDKLNVTGEYYKKTKGKIEQSNGSFPIPKVIYLQCYADHELLTKIEETAGCRVFNNFIFEKWQCWKLLSRNKMLSSHLPDTQQLCNEADFKKFVNRYQDVFLKPISPIDGYNARGLVRVRMQKEKNIEAIYQKKLKTDVKEFESYDHLWSSIQQMVSVNPYIVQQSIPTVNLNGMPVDFRLNMNKNGKGDWEVAALFVRIALNGSHVAGGRGIQYLPFDIREFLNLIIFHDENKTTAKLSSIKDLGFKICQTFDQSGYHVADIGIDLGMDENGHLWIFEVNPLPCPYVPPVKDESWVKPFDYAQYLMEKGKRG